MTTGHWARPQCRHCIWFNPCACWCELREEHASAGSGCIERIYTEKARLAIEQFNQYRAARARQTRAAKAAQRGERVRIGRPPNKK